MIKGIRAGSESSYARLFDMYYRPLSVFAVKYVKELEIAKEIAQQLNISIRTVETQISNALKAIRQKLGEDLGSK